MRKLQSTDIFTCCRLITEIGLKDEIKQIALGANKVSDISIEEVGFNLIWAIFEKATTKKAEEKVFNFLADILEEDAETLKASDPSEFIDKIVSIEGWASFFSSVASLMKLK